MDLGHILNHIGGSDVGAGIGCGELEQALENGDGVGVGGKVSEVDITWDGKTDLGGWLEDTNSVLEDGSMSASWWVDTLSIVKLHSVLTSWDWWLDASSILQCGSIGAASWFLDTDVVGVKFESNWASSLVGLAHSINEN